MSSKQPYQFVCAIFFLSVLAACKKSPDNPAPLPPVTTPPPVVQEWKFETTPEWEEEFNTAGAPAAETWIAETGGHGWGNNELQYYTNNANATIANGILTITARKENFQTNQYTSARLITKGKKQWLYGSIEVRAKLPSGRGTWPAIWMLPADNNYGTWPASGEIDIMEHVGFDENRVHITVHTAAFNHTLNTQKGSSKVIDGATSGFHNYRVNWAPYGIRGYIDDVQIFEFLNTNKGPNEWPFDKPFFLILNIAVGGSWGGQQGINDAIFPASFEIDRIRSYKFLK